ncbi:hypothetical protein V2O64_15305 [Verrucomicrobiaceae bacterium 227]
MKISHLFHAGATILALSSSGFAQDPFADTPKPPPPKPEDAWDRIQCVYEAFSLPKSEAAELQRTGQNDQELYTVLIASVAEKKAKQEKLIALRCLPGNLATVEHSSKFIYPTEFEPARMPLSTSTGIGIPLQNTSTPDATPKTTTLFPSTPASPSAFDTKNLGDTLHISALRDVQRNLLEIRFTYDCVKLLQMDSWGQGLSETKTPRFSTQRSDSSITVKSGTPTFVGTVTPALEAQNPDSGERVWFAFLTTTVIKSAK